MAYIDRKTHEIYGVLPNSDDYYNGYYSIMENFLAVDDAIAETISLLMKKGYDIHSATIGTMDPVISIVYTKRSASRGLDMEDVRIISERDVYRFDEMMTELVIETPPALAKVVFGEPTIITSLPSGFDYDEEDQTLAQFERTPTPTDEWKRGLDEIDMTSMALNAWAEFVPNWPIPEGHYIVDVYDGTGDKKIARVGETVSIKAVAPTEEDVFSGWLSLDNKVVFADSAAAETTFTMPDYNVEIDATFNMTRYTMMVADGISYVNSAITDEIVYIDAVVNPEKPDEFIGWSSTNPEVNFEDEKAPSTSFAMPASDVVVVAEYDVEDYRITMVTAGTTSSVPRALPGDEVTVTVETIGDNDEFVKWISDPTVAFADETALSTTFTMPESNVNVMAVINEAHMISVVNGSADFTEALKDETITVIAIVPEEKEFDGWTATPSVVFADPTATTTTFTMLDSDVAVTANLVDIVYDVTVVGGTSDVATAAKDATVSVTATVPEGDTFTGWTSVPEVTFADSAAETTTFTMPGEGVVITATFNTPTYTVTVTGGTADPTSGGEGDEISVEADAPAEGKVFSGWSSVPEVTFADETATPTTFAMPASDVAVAAAFSDVSYAITVTGGTSDVATAVLGTTVAVNATIPAEMEFASWTAIPEVTFADATSADTTFAMPASDVAVTANFSRIVYDVTVTDGTSDVAEAAEGDEVTVTPAAIPGKVFQSWSAVPTVEFVVVSGNISKFIMPGEAIVVTASFVDAEVPHTITVVEGTANVEESLAGETITVTATDTPTSGDVFIRWTTETPDVTFADAGTTPTTFAMPDSDVTVTAVFGYSVTVNGGSSNMANAAEADTVTITLGAVAVGKEFSGWTVVPDTVVLADASAVETTFTMPGEAVTVTATFTDILYAVTVTDGTSDPTSAILGATVTVTANSPAEGQEFSGWTSVPEVTFADSTVSPTTFTMPAEEVGVTANFTIVSTP